MQEHRQQIADRVQPSIEAATAETPWHVATLQKVAPGLFEVTPEEASGGHDFRGLSRWRRTLSQSSMMQYIVVTSVFMGEIYSGSV